MQTLQQEIQRSEESRYDHRLHGVLLVAHGVTCPAVAALLGDAPRSAEYWVPGSGQVRRRAHQLARTEQDTPSPMRKYLRRSVGAKSGRRPSLPGRIGAILPSDHTVIFTMHLAQEVLQSRLQPDVRGRPAGPEKRCIEHIRVSRCWVPGSRDSTINQCRPFGRYFTCSQRRKRSIARPTASYIRV